ncbi:MAG: TRAP transporter large permease subunit [Myxococcota bacterium]|nr:TRAP transporter large permease subunit [Myxococcota bacterium]
MSSRNLLDILFAPLDLIAGGWNRFSAACRRFGRQVLLLKVVFVLILLVGGIYHYLARILGLLDRALDRIETTFIFFTTLMMTGLVTLHFVNTKWNLWSLDTDVKRLALLSMLWLAFVGASLAARDDKHLAIDAAARTLSPVGASRLYRVSMFLAAGFSWFLFTNSMTMIRTHLRKKFSAKFEVPEAIIEPLNRWGEWVAVHLIQHEIDPTKFAKILDKGIAVDIKTGALRLWTWEIILPFVFLVMTLRFAGKFFRGKRIELQPDQIPARSMQRNPSNAGRKDIAFAGLVPGLLFGLLLGLWLGQGWLVVMCAVLLLLSGAPLFVVIGAAASMCVMLLEGREDASLVVGEIRKAADKDPLLAIPLFVVAGAIMTEGSIAQRLIDMARSAMGWMPGGLAISGVFACMVFAAISGSSPVTVIAIGSIMVPALLESKYDEHFSLGLMTSAGSLGILIPPSIPMIVYAVVCFQQRGLVSRFTDAQPNMGDLFVAGILPGILIGLILILWSVFKARDKVLPVQETLHKFPLAFTRGIWAAGLPILIIGGIYSGWFLATEAAAVSVVYALAVEYVIHPTIKWFAHRRGEQLNEPLFELPLTRLPKVLRDSAVIMGALLLIVVLAIAFNQFLVQGKVPDQAAMWVKGHVDSKLQFLIMVNIFLLLVGCVMDIISAILIVAPLLAPIAVSQYGIDPIHFGIIFIVNLEIGYLTPPLGLNLFVASSVFDKPILKVIRSVLPFMLLLLLALIIICWWEGLTGMLLSPR